METKSHIRKVILQYRRLIDYAVYVNRNELLSEQVNSFIQHIDFKKIHTFLPIKNNREPDITSVYKLMWSQGKKIVVSKTDFKLTQMSHYLLTVTTELSDNEKGIPEPVNGEETIIEDVDIIFVPLIVADKAGNRIGYGGGYYDRLLKETKAIKIGLSLSGPVDKLSQSDEWDIPLDYLITPFKIFNYG